MVLNSFSSYGSLIIRNLGGVLYGRVQSLSSIRSFAENSIKEAAEKDLKSEPNQLLPPSRAEQPNSEANMVKRMLENQHMQPAFLPEYYQSPIDLNAGTYPNPSSFEIQFGASRDRDIKSQFPNILTAIKSISPGKNDEEVESKKTEPKKTESNKADGE